MEGRLTFGECIDSLFKMKFNKATGIDGLLKRRILQNFFEKLKVLLYPHLIFHMKRVSNYFSEIISYNLPYP